jgi:hypothetical protein
MGPLKSILDGMRILAALHVESSVPPDGVSLGGTQVLLAFRADMDWNAEAVRAALTSAAGPSETVSALGLAWKNTASQGAAFSQWNGLHPLVVYAEGPLLLLSNTPALMAASLARAARATGEGGKGRVFLARYNHAAELKPYLEPLEGLDFDGTGRPDGNPSRREPHFFSEVVGSLGTALDSVRAVAIEVRDESAVQRRTIRYEWR